MSSTTSESESYPTSENVGGSSGVGGIDPTTVGVPDLPLDETSQWDFSEVMTSTRLESDVCLTHITEESGEGLI